MSYFSPEWITKAAQLWGGAPVLRVSVRAPEAGSTVQIITALEEVLDLSPIVMEREREFSVVQGQAWQVTLTNVRNAAAIRGATGGWARLEVGYDADNVWETLAIGKVEDARVSVDGTVSLEVEDQLVTLVNAVLKQPIRFQDTAWVGKVVNVKLAEESVEYDHTAVNAGCEIVAGAASIQDETFRVVFTSATGFKIVLPSGNQSQTGTITTDCTFVRDGGTGSIKINQEGWSSATGAYATDDEFSISTARARTANELSAVGMIRHLIVDVAAIQVYDFDTDTMVSPLYEPDNWTALVTETLSDQCFGTFEKDARIIDMVQGIMPLHIAVFTRPNGKIAVWYMLPAEGGGPEFNGNHDGRDVHIMAGSSVRNTMQGVYNRVVYNYKARGSGADASYEAKDASSLFPDDRPLVIDIPWEINPLSVVTAADRSLVRFKSRRRPFEINMPLIGATVDVGETISITDSALDANNESVGVTRVSIDPLNCAASIYAVLETITLGGYFRIAADDESSGNRIGDSGDAGSGRIY